MFQNGGGGLTTRFGAGGAAGGGQSIKLLISNLDYGVSDADIKVCGVQFWFQYVWLDKSPYGYGVYKEKIQDAFLCTQPW